MIRHIEVSQVKNIHGDYHRGTVHAEQDNLTVFDFVLPEEITDQILDLVEAFVIEQMEKFNA